MKQVPPVLCLNGALTALHCYVVDVLIVNKLIATFQNVNLLEIGNDISRQPKGPLISLFDRVMLAPHP